MAVKIRFFKRIERRYLAISGITGRIKKWSIVSSYLLSIFFCFIIPVKSIATELSDLGLHVIPFPQQVQIGGTDFVFNNYLNIVLDKNHSAADKFTANELINDLKNEWNIDAKIAGTRNNYSIVLTRQKLPLNIGKQGYRVSVSKNEITITAAGEDGLFYGTQTLLQLIQKNAPGHKVPGLKITDWPDIKERAVHYDTKHHQDKISYVKSFIKELARYKINILVWEWEVIFLNLSINLLILIFYCGCQRE